MPPASSVNLQRQVWIMAKVHRKVNANEDRCEKLHMEMNMKAGPTRKEPLTVFVLPDLDPMQKQLNRGENTLHYEERCNRRKAWRNSCMRRR